MGTRGRWVIAVVKKEKAGKTRVVVTHSGWRRHDAYPQCGLGKDVCEVLKEVDLEKVKNDADGVGDAIAKAIYQRADDDTHLEEEHVGKDIDAVFRTSQEDVFCEHVYGIVLHPNARSASMAITVRYSNIWIDIDNFCGGHQSDEDIDVEVSVDTFGRLVKDPKPFHGLNTRTPKKKKRKAGRHDEEPPATRPMVSLQCNLHDELPLESIHMSQALFKVKEMLASAQKLEGASIPEPFNRDSFVFVFHPTTEHVYCFPGWESENRDNNAARVKEGVAFFVAKGFVAYSSD